MNVMDLAYIESHKVNMMFYPEAWDNAPVIELDWTELDFPPNPRNLIPQEPGVYAFVIEPSLFSLEPVNGLFYVGKATNLYQRISAYISELSKDFIDTRRPLVWKMLNQWNGRIKYYYSTTEDVTRAELIEEEILKALLPPFNRQFDAETSQVMRAFQ